MSTAPKWTLKRHLIGSDRWSVFDEDGTQIAAYLRLPKARLVQAAPELLEALKEAWGGLSFFAGNASFGMCAKWGIFEKEQKYYALLARIEGREP